LFSVHVYLFATESIIFVDIIFGNMRITLISFDNWGLNKHISSTLKQRGHEVHHIDFHSFSYKYPNPLYKVYNFFLKAFLKKNIKNIYYGQEIIKKVKTIGDKHDIILTIKGDFIDPKYLSQLKQFTNKSIGFFNDNTYRCPKIKRAIPCFHEVYSFEKEDCETYDLKLATNWIYTQKSIRRMYEEAGYNVQVNEGINRTKSLKPYLYNIPFFFTQMDIFYLQYATVASKK
jgi:hypothetical protein